MQSGYEMILDPSAFVWTLLAMVIHAFTLGMQLGLVVFLVGTGGLALFFPTADGPWLRRLGVTPTKREADRRLGVVRFALGIALLLPFVAGAPPIISLLANLVALVLLIVAERRLPSEVSATGRLSRRVAAAAAALLVAFGVWEGEDPLDLGIEVYSVAQHWRTHELGWQLTHDSTAPKVGELAPDFELQDPSGATAVRLADFRGKRPVALIFGSYT